MRALLPALCLATTTAMAQQPFDCMQSSPHRAFDFWLGEWEVRGPAGKLAGRNRITLEERGCALRERWESTSGGTGQSLNYYDAVSGQWRQLWLDAGSTIVDIAGGLEGSSMVLSGTIRYLAGGNTAAFRGRWTPLEDGRVRQFFEQRDEAGQWQTWFEGFYSRVGEPGD